MSSRTGGQGTTRPGPFLLAATVSVLGVVAVYLFFVHTTTGQYFDESALVEAGVLREKIGTQVSYFLDLLPLISVVIGLVVILFVTIRRRRWLACGIAVLAMTGANLSTQVTKELLPVRPDEGVATLDFNSLPSGHSTLAASAAAAVFLVVSPRWRPFAGFIGASFAILSGTSTLINQWHRPADVLAAYLVVTAWASIAGWLIMRWGASWNVWHGHGAHWASSRFWPLISTLLGVAAAVISVVMLGRLAAPGAQSVTDYFFFGVAMIVIAGYLLTVAGTLLFGFEARCQPLNSR